jgi:hypothetical protein
VGYFYCSFWLQGTISDCTGENDKTGVSACSGSKATLKKNGEGKGKHKTNTRQNNIKLGKVHK